MKAIKCQMCDSSDFVKDGDYFVCQSCGVKYTVEDARKMMIEGIVDVKGTVKVDHSEELERLYRAARNALQTSDSDSAIRHYEAISAIEPDSWEALFYLVVLKTNSITNGEISSASVSVSNCLNRVFELISTVCNSDDEKKAAIDEVTDQCYSTAQWLTNASRNYYKSVTKGNGMMALTGVVGAISSLSSTGNARNEEQSRCFNIANIMSYCGVYIEQYFDMNDDDYKLLASWSYEKMLEFNNSFKNTYKCDLYSKDYIAKIKSVVDKYNGNGSQTNYTDNNTEKSGGCYVATAVYGSYDCPEVWTLRRYRDYTLAKTWYGRAFIKTYYAISPTLVKWFGDTKWFKKLWKGKLDRMVVNLQTKGVDNSPYEDKKW